MSHGREEEQIEPSNRNFLIFRGSIKEDKPYRGEHLQRTLVFSKSYWGSRLAVRPGALPYNFSEMLSGVNLSKKKLVGGKDPR